MIGAVLRARVRARIGRLALDATLETGGTLVLVGPNGAGKSSLLLALLGVLRPDEGHVTLGETPLFDSAAGVDVPLEQRRIGFVPQNWGLFPHLDVGRTLAFAVASAPTRRSRVEREARVDALMDAFGLARLRDQAAPTLSGGERQRLAIARAVAAEPRALLLDEPLAALDVGARDEVREVLAGHLARLALPAIVVTHDADDVRRLAHRVAVMESGRIVATDGVEAFVASPPTAFVARLLGPGAGR